EPSLQTVMDQRLNFAPHAMADCVAEGNDAYWRIRGKASATLLVEVAGFADRNTLGLYDRADPSRRIQIFGGSNASFDTRTITVTNTGGAFRFDIARPNGQILTSTVFVSENFGYYFTTPQNASMTYFSDTALNPDGVDHLYAYQGNDSKFRSNQYVPFALRGKTFDPGMYLLAWEDLLHGGDFDYQDMAVLTREVVPVPLPAALGLFGSGLALFGFLRRRRTTVSA
ncbi:MAG TPA: DUF4114 domain-containing protein, partial [Burkholderiales bacterium]|nr:DUF4114 domain-containing protein [Burkholderiales bacterium]